MKTKGPGRLVRYKDVEMFKAGLDSKIIIQAFNGLKELWSIQVCVCHIKCK